METLQINQNVAVDSCGTTEDIQFAPCQSLIDTMLPTEETYYELDSTGRMLSLKVGLQNVCPGRRIALGIIVTEVIGTEEYTRGFKAITVPEQAQTTSPCRDIIIGDICFILPDGLDGAPMHCGQRDFKVTVIAHYIDAFFPQPVPM